MLTTLLASVKLATKVTVRTLLSISNNTKAQFSITGTKCSNSNQIHQQPLNKTLASTANYFIRGAKYKHALS